MPRPLIRGVLVLPMFFLAIPATSHEPVELTSAESSEGLDGRPQLPAGMVLPEAEGPRPWSDKPVLNDPDRFQIAIMTDRTGGHRPGVWMDAVRKVNLLRPEFVMSVGDLIEGYTENRGRLESEWKEFLGFIDKMEMKFFFVAGNHDVHNPVQHEVWREKFGDVYYSFDYRGVHFLCLCSEDPETRIGDEQLAWIENDLKENKDTRWTLVFLHKPLWVYAEQAQVAGNADRTNWKRVESMLADRPHTVFAGHVHHYVQYERNGGMQYFSLATTGGGSQMRGDAYGEFDHLMWLTMESDGPRLAVLRLDGIRAPGVVTEESAERFGRFLREARVDVAPILLENEHGFGEGDINLRLTNDFDEAVKVTARIDGLPLQGLTVEPSGIELKAKADGSEERDVHVRFEELINFNRLSATTLTTTIETTGDNPLRAERVAPVVIDRRHLCPLIAELPAVDGLVEDWPERSYSTPPTPTVLGDPRAWTGGSDGSLEFHTAHTGDKVYLAIRVKDEALVAGDRIEVFFDGRGLARRAQSPELGPRACRVSVSPVEPDAGGEGASLGDYAVWAGRGRNPIEGAEYAAKATEDGYTVEIALPEAEVLRQQGADWHSFQAAIVMHDVDEAGGPKSRVLWRGSPDVGRFNRGYGYFMRSDD